MVLWLTFPSANVNTPVLDLSLIWFYNVLKVETTRKALPNFIYFFVLNYPFDLVLEFSCSNPETESIFCFEKQLLFLESF